jgi:hypothetical protein
MSFRSLYVRSGLVLAAVAVLAAAPAARAQVGPSFTLEGFGGWQNLQLSANSVGNAVDGNEGTAILGVDGLAGIGGFGFGAVIDKTVSGSAQPWAGALMAGILIPVSVVRIEALGELGRRARDFGDLFNSTGQTFLGFRPGVSFRLAPTAIVLGVSGVARWPTSGGDFGSPDFGIVGRVGFGFF